MATVTYEQTQRDSGPARAKPSRRRVAVWFAIVALLLALVGGGLVAFDRFRSKAIADFFASQVPPPTPVAAEPARVGPMPRYLDGIGTLTAVREVQVSPELAGTHSPPISRSPSPSPTSSRCGLMEATMAKLLTAGGARAQNVSI